MGTPTTATASLISKQDALKFAPLRFPSRSGEAHIRIRLCLKIRWGKAIFLSVLLMFIGTVARNKASPLREYLQANWTAAERS